MRARAAPQQAKSLGTPRRNEPRASLALSGQAARQARELLAPVYGWLTEGFDTLELKEAKVLLDSLEARVCAAHQKLKQGFFREESIKHLIKRNG